MSHFAPRRPQGSRSPPSASDSRSPTSLFRINTSVPQQQNEYPTPTDLRSYMGLVAAEASQSQGYQQPAVHPPASDLSLQYYTPFPSYPPVDPYYPSLNPAPTYLETPAYPPYPLVYPSSDAQLAGFNYFSDQLQSQVPLEPAPVSDFAYAAPPESADSASYSCPSDSEASAYSAATSSISRASSRSSARSSGSSKEKRYFCDECGEGFARNFNLKSHISCKHKGEKPFACSCCTKRFSRKHDTARHLTARHGYSNSDAQADVHTRYPSGSAPLNLD